MSLVRPDRVNKTEIIGGEGGEKVHGTLIVCACRAREDLVVSEHEDRQTQLRIDGNAHVHAAEGGPRQVFCGVIRGRKDLVEVSAAGATAVVDADLPGDVGGARRSYGGWGGRRIDGLAHAVGIGQAAVVRPLHVNVEGGRVMVFKVSRRNVDGIVPLAVVPGNQGRSHVGWAEGVASIC